MWSPIVITILVSLLGIIIIVLSIVLFNTNSSSPESVTLTPTPSPQYAKHLFVPIYSDTMASLSVIHTTSLKVIASGISVGESARKSCFAFLSPDQKTLYVVNQGGAGSVSIMNVSDTTNISVVVILELSSQGITEMSMPSGCCLSSDASLLYIACHGINSGGIAVYKTADYSFQKFITAPELLGPDAVVVDGTNNHLYVSNTFASPATMVQLDGSSYLPTKIYSLTSGTESLQKFATSSDFLNLYAVASAPSSNVLPLSIFASNAVTNTDPIGLNCHQIAVNSEGNTLFVLSNNSFIPVDITDRQNPIILYEHVVALPDNSEPYGITCNQKNIFISDSVFSSVYVFNVATPYTMVSTITIEGVSRWTSNLQLV